MLENASQFPKIFYARHMQPGLAQYENERILVDTDAMKAMLPTAVGKPIYIHHQEVDLDRLKEKAAGYIVRSFYNSDDGWAWFECLAIDDELHNAIAKGWSVSNAYRPTQWGVGGTKNNVVYDREVRNGEFTHLAIVPNPRYEDAAIMSQEKFKSYQESKKRELQQLHNSKSQPKGSPMLKFFKNKQEEVSAVDADTLVELQNGKQISVKDMIAAVENDAKAKAEQATAEERANALESTVEVAGKKMAVKDLVAEFEKLNAKKAKKNADEDEDEDKGEDKENEDGDDEECKDKDKKNKKNSKDGADQKHFDELRNAQRNAKPQIQVIETSMDKIARGKSRYGSAA